MDGKDFRWRVIHSKFFGEGGVRHGERRVSDKLYINI